MANKAYYENSADISYYFRNLESIKELLTFVFDECTLFADAIDRNKSKLCYPIILDPKSYNFQIEYQFLVHAIAKFIAKKTNDKINYRRVLKDFALLKMNINYAEYKKNRNLLIYFMERFNQIVTINKLDTKIKFTNIYAPKLLKFNDIFIEFKAVSFSNSDKPDVQKLGPSFYYGSQWIEFRERFRLENMPVQVAFGPAIISKYCEDNDVKKHTYFHIDFDLLDGMIDYDLMVK